MVVNKNLFSQSVLDIAWSPDGYTLLSCSTDGTAISLHFDVKEACTTKTLVDFDCLEISLLAYSPLLY